jgi:hypothetical protein
MTATTIAAVVTKTAVAASERGDSRAKPQAPCPDVQPPPSRVPKPTSRPATAVRVKLAGIFGGSTLKPAAPAMNGTTTRPRMKAMRHAPSRPPSKHPARMPLILAMRPRSSIRQVADNPISAPPISAEVAS